MRIFAIFLAVLVCLSSVKAQAEQVRVMIDEKYSEATLVSHRGNCILVSVQHVFNFPEEVVKFERDGDPLTYSAKVMSRPGETQSSNFAGWASVPSDSGLSCSQSLAESYFDRWTAVLGDMLRQSGLQKPYRPNFFIKLRARSGLVPVRVSLWGPSEADLFRFTLDPGFNGIVPDRAGISGSGVYVGLTNSSGQTETHLIGLVEGPDGVGVYRAFRIERIANALGLVGGEGGPEQKGTDGRPTLAGELVGRPTKRSSVVYPPHHTRCDVTAANPFDPDRFPGVEGKSYDAMVSLSKAELVDILELCQNATSEFPDSARLAYQEARVLYFLQLGFPDDYSFSSAIDALNKAQAMGHPYARVNIDVLLLNSDQGCPDYDTCFSEHDLSVDFVRRNFTDIEHLDAARLRDFKRLVDSDLAREGCPDWAVCHAEGATVLKEITDPDVLPVARFNLAWMYVALNYADHCGGQDNCKPVVAQWLDEAVKAEVKNAAYWQGKFLGRQSELPGVCDTRLACQTAAIAAYEKSGAWVALGDLAYEAEWREAFGCGDRDGCVVYAHEKYLAAAELKYDTGRINAAWNYLFEQEAIGCEEADICFSQARELLDAVDDKTTSLYLRRRGELLRVGQSVLSDLCEGAECDLQSAQAYLAAEEAGDTSSQSPFWVARFAETNARAFSNGDTPPGTATGCKDARTCMLTALEWYEKAGRRGNAAYLLDEWLDLLEEPPVVVDDNHSTETASISSWLELSANVDISENRWAFSKFASWALDDSKRVHQLCLGLEDTCEVRAAEILDLGLKTKDERFLGLLSGWIGPALYLAPEGPHAEIIRKILLRSTPLLDKYNIYDIAYSGLFRELGCPVGKLDCTPDQKRPISDMVAERGTDFLPQLHLLVRASGWKSTLKGVRFMPDHLFEHEDILLAAQILARHDVPLGNFLLAVHANEGGGADIGWSETGAKLHRRAAGTLSRSIPLIPQLDACRGAVVLATMNNRTGWRILPSQAEIDAFVLALAYCGQDDLFYSSKRRLEQDRALALSVQTALATLLNGHPVQGNPLKVDGEFRDQSWEAAALLHGLAVDALPEDRALNRMSQVAGFDADGQSLASELNRAHERLARELGSF